MGQHIGVGERVRPRSHGQAASVRVLHQPVQAQGRPLLYPDVMPGEQGQVRLHNVVAGLLSTRVPAESIGSDTSCVVETQILKERAGREPAYGLQRPRVRDDRAVCHGLGTQRSRGAPTDAAVMPVPKLPTKAFFTVNSFPFEWRAIRGGDVSRPGAAGQSNEPSG